MPRIKRWFPVSQDINSDPEVWEMRQTFGEWSLALWLQILSVADRNEGEIRGDKEWIAYSMTFVWGSNSRRYNTEWRRDKISKTLEWMANKGWIEIERDLIRVRNYVKYHKTREPNKIPSGEQTGSLPSEPSEPSELKESEHPQGVTFGNSKEDEHETFKKAVEAMWKRVQIITRSDPNRFGRTLGTWAAQMIQKGWQPKDIRETLEEFVRFEDSHSKIQEWYPYLNRILQSRKTKEHQAESEQHKQYDPQSAGAILKKMTEGKFNA